MDRLILEAWEQMQAAVTKGWIDPKTNGKIKRSASGVAYITFVMTDGSIHHSINQACHAGLMIIYEDHGKLTPKYVVSRIQWENNYGEKLSNKCVDAFLRWLTCKSPYAKVFITKGGKSNRKRGFLAVRTDVPSNLMAGALFASRMITEHQGMIARAWYEMQKRGVHPAIAFCLAHEFDCNDGKWIIKKPISWHVALPGGHMSHNYILSFKNGVHVSPNEYYNEHKTYNRVHALWGEEYGNAPKNLKEIINKSLEGAKEAVVGKIVNPFKQNAREREGSRLDLFMDLFCPAIIEYYGKEND